MRTIRHQYIERDSGQVRTEKLYGDQFIRLLYNNVRENAPLLFRLCTSAQASSLLSYLNFDAPLAARFTGNRRFLEECGVDFAECLTGAAEFATPREIFERRIRYWECRPMTEDDGAVVSPADARVLVGSFLESSALFLKEKFFAYEELLGRDKREWLRSFQGGDFVVCRLTPDKYHYNHTPVAGKVVDVYQIPGGYHSCNPDAIVQLATPFSKNKRVVTIINTDVQNGSNIGLVAMVEVVALMIGDIIQRYSEVRYDFPQKVERGMFLKKGAPKSLYRPGSSTDVLIFQKGRISFAADLIRNMYDPNAESRFSHGFGRPLVETDVKVRSQIASRL
jgi:phosphatidylserine decarboxylase